MQRLVNILRRQVKQVKGNNPNVAKASSKSKVFISKPTGVREGRCLFVFPPSRNDIPKLALLTKDNLETLAKQHYEGVKHEDVTGRSPNNAQTLSVELKPLSGLIWKISALFYPRCICLHSTIKDDRDTLMTKEEVKLHLSFLRSIYDIPSPAELIIPKIFDPFELRMLLAAAWDKQTSSDPENWSVENTAWANVKLVH